MTKRMYPTHPILLVDDEETWLRSFTLALKSNGIDNIICCQDSREVTGILAEQDVEVIAADLSMPGLTGEELIAQVRESHPDIPILVITGMGQVETAVKCIKLGAFDFFVKTYDKSSLVSGIRHAVEIRELKRENSSLRSRFMQDTLDNPEAFSEIITCSKQMRSIFQYVEAVADSAQPVLITGESGVGKELMARAVHRLSNRSGEFVPVNVAGLDDTVFADTLFGHRKGAFTGADKSRPGLVESAKGGTLFLDEIGDLSNASQLKLLRLVQEREYHPLGSDLARKTDTRIIAATNVDVTSPGEAERFRNDLYYRLRAHHVHIPPLRERKEDLPRLVQHFVRMGCGNTGRKQLTVPPECVALLTAYHFPGNIRELQFLILDAVSCSIDGQLDLERLRHHLGPLESQPATIPSCTAGTTEKVAFGQELPTLKEVCEELVEEALRRTDGNQAMAAKLLGVSRQALNKRINKMRTRSSGE